MDSKERLIDILKDKYDYEQDRRKSFDSMLNLPITLLAFLTAGAAYILNGNDVNCHIWFPMIKPFLIILIFISSCLTIYFVFKVYFEYKREYNAIPGSNVIKNDYNKILTFVKHQRLTPELTNEKVDEEFGDFIIDWYVSSTTHNTKVNDNRAKYYYTSKIFIGISYCLLIFTYFLYFVSKI